MSAILGVLNWNTMSRNIQVRSQPSYLCRLA